MSGEDATTRTRPGGEDPGQGHGAAATVTGSAPSDRSGRRPRFGGPLGRTDFAVAGALALVAMVVVVVFRSALVPTDPWHYVHGAIDFPNGTWRPEGLSRWGFLLPMIPFARLWGDSTATYYAVPVLSAGVLAAVLYLLGTRHVSRVTGVIGTVMALGTPLVFVNLSRGYTDLTATTLCGLALLLAVVARDAADASGGWDRRVAALVVGCGFFAGWSVEVRETAIFTWPVLAWTLWGLGRPLRTAVWAGVPVLGWALLDILLSAVIYDDPLLKLRYVLGADISSSVVLSDAGYVGHSRWWYATVLPRSLWQLTGGPAIVICLVVAIVGGFLLRAHVGRIWAWGMLALVPLWLQGGVLDPGHPSVRLDVARYWLSFLAPLMLTAVGVAVIVVRRARGKGKLVSGGVAALLGLGVLVPAASYLGSYPGFAPNGGDAMVQLRDELARTGVDPSARVWADWGTQRVLPTYQNSPFGTRRWSARSFRSLNHLFDTKPTTAAGYPRPGDYVVIYSDADRSCWHCRRALRPVERAFGPFPAQGWDLLFTSSAGNLRLYRLDEDVAWPMISGEESDTPAEEAEDDSGDEPEPGL